MIRARQQGFPPVTFDKIYRVGAYHAASIPTPIKGARPPMKTYTDLRCEMEDLHVSGGMGLEPTVAQLTKAFKRLIPPDNMKPDGTAVSSLPGNPRLRQSDKMRYVWRGGLRLGINRMKLIFGTGAVAQPLPQHDPHMVLTANTLCWTVGTGKMDVASTGVAVMGYARSPSTPGPGDPLLALPFFYLPLLNVGTTVKWAMPNGRDPLDHHIYPRVTDWAQLQNAPLQVPLNTVYLASSESCSIGLDFSIARDHTDVGKRATERKAAEKPSLLSHHFSADASGLQPSSVSRIYIGELQVAFIKDVVRQFSHPPAYLKSSSKRRAFYEPLRHSGPAAALEVAAATGVSPAKLLINASGSAALPQGSGKGTAAPESGPPPVPGSGPVLMKRLDVGVSADVVELYHDAQDVDDPSDFVVLRLTNAFYSSSFLYFPTTRVVERSNGTYTRPTKRKVMTALTVEARNLQLSQTLGNHPTGPRKGAAKATGAAGAWGRGGSGSGPNPNLEFGKGLILSATCLMLKQAPLRHSGTTWGEPGRNGSDRRPMRIVVQDVQLLGSSRLRDVCVATATHLMTAFSCQKPAPKPSSFLSKHDREHAEQQRQAKQGGKGPKKESGGAAGSGARNVARVRTMGRAPEPGRDVMLRDEEVLLRQLVEAHKQRALATPSAAQLRLGQEGDEEGGTVPPDAPTSPAHPLSPVTSLPELSRQTSAGSKSLHRSSSSGDKSMRRSESLKRVVEGLQLVLEVEFKRLQISLVPENCPGSLLLSTDAALLTLHRAPDTGERRLELTMDHLQAYASRPHRTKSGACAPASLPWLQPAKPAPDTVHNEEIGRESPKATAPPETHPGRTTPPSNAAATVVATSDSGSGVSNRSPLRKRLPSFGSRLGGGTGGSGFEDKGAVGSPLGPRGSAAGGVSSIRLKPSPSRRASPKHRRMFGKLSRLSLDGSYSSDGGGVETPPGAPSAGLTVPQGESGGLSAIMQPFSMHLLHVRVPAKEDHEEEEGDTNELVMQVPFVEGQLDSWQFDVIMDLITSVFTAPMPKVPILLLRTSDQQICLEAAAAGVKESSPLCGEVVGVTETLVSLRQRKHCLQRELRQVSPNLVHALWAADDQGQGVPFCPTMQQVESALALVPHHMEYHPSLLSHMHVGPGSSVTSNTLARNLQVLVAWHLDQVVGAAESVISTEQVLMGLRTRMTAQMASLTRKRASKNGSCSSTIVLGGLKWGLSRGGSVFVVAELSGLEFTTAEDQAGMGSTRLQLHRILLRDTQKLVGKAPGMDPGVILSLWNPGSHAAQPQERRAESVNGGEGNQLMQEPSPWEHDNALTLYAIHGGKDPRVVVYDHIEVVLHPLLVHITFNLAQTLQDYFNLREPEECVPCRDAAGNAPSASAQEGLPPKAQLKKTGSKKPSWLQRHSTQAPRMSDVGSTSGNAFSPLEAGRMRLGVNQVQQLHPHVSPDPNAPPPTALNPTFSLPFSSITVEGTDPAVGVPVAILSAESNRFGPVVRRSNRGQAQSGSIILAGAQQGVQGPLTSGMAKGRGSCARTRCGRGVSAGQMPTSSAQQYQTLNAPPSSTSAHPQQQQQQQPDKKEHNPKKIYRFKHVRFNRMHVRLSYEGPPLSVTNFMLVLDASVYRGLEGGWRTILNRYKKDVIVSLLKSMAGWQNRKVKELERGAAASAAASAAAAAVDSTGLTNLRDTDPSALLAAGMQGGSDAGSVSGQGRHKGIRSHVKSWLGNIGVMHSSSAEAGGASAVRRSSAEERAIADLIAAAERARVRQQKVVLLLGPNVPPPPARKLLQ